MADSADILERWLRHRSVTQDLAGRLPDNLAGFAPWPGAMTTGALIVHIAQSHRGLTAVARGLDRPAAPEIDSSDLRAVRAFLDRATAEDTTAISAMTAADLDAMRGPEPQRAGRTVLQAAHDHEIHHKGQLFVYARLNGIEVPFYTRR